MRDKHTFHFSAKMIAEAASEEAAYHRAREQWWREEYLRADEAVQKTMKITRQIYSVTGGSRIDYDIDFGDSVAHGRMQEAYNKVHSHRQEAEKLETDAKLYRTQDRSYELDPGDVHYYRLNGRPRTED